MVRHNFSLIKYNTFGLKCFAETFITPRTEDEAVSIVQKSVQLSKPVFVLGAGSNLLFIADFKGTILHPEMTGIRIEKETDDDVIISAGAGVVWDNFVEWTVNHGLGGLENLSLIPGTTGAAPVQNIGAYGVEVKDTIEKVRAISIPEGVFREFNNAECRLGYRDSIFKNELKDKYMITRVFFRLSRHHVLNTSYEQVKNEAQKLGRLSIKTIRGAVIKIRRNKLPDPGVIGNAGSFFRNPVVTIEKAAMLKEKYPDIPLYPDPSGGIKIAAAWLIEECGWKGKRAGDAGVHGKQALVLVNYGRATGKEIFDLSEKIRESVFERFGINLEREVEVIGDL